MFSPLVEDPIYLIYSKYMCMMQFIEFFKYEQNDLILTYVSTLAL